MRGGEGGGVEKLYRALLSLRCLGQSGLELDLHSDDNEPESCLLAMIVQHSPHSDGSERLYRTLAQTSASMMTVSVAAPPIPAPTAVFLSLGQARSGPGGLPPSLVTNRRPSEYPALQA